MLLLHGAAGAKRLRFLKYHLGAVVVFALLYKAQDEFMSRFPEQAKSLGLGHTHPPADPFYYWLWYSALTQSTIGYAGPVTRSGHSVSYIAMPNVAYKIINMAQVLSVIVITAILI